MDWLAGLKPRLVEPPTTLPQDAPKRVGPHVPRRFDWSSILDPALAQRVASATGVQDGHDAIWSERVVIMGPPGSGKTSLVVAMFRARFDDDEHAHHERYRFVPARRLGTARIQHGAGHGEPEEVWAAIMAPMVVIDDVGAERQTQNNAVEDVVSERFDEMRTTWITTGLTADELATRYSGGFARRLFEGATVIKLGTKR